MNASEDGSKLDPQPEVRSYGSLFQLDRYECAIQPKPPADRESKNRGRWSIVAIVIVYGIFDEVVSSFGTPTFAAKMVLLSLMVVIGWETQYRLFKQGRLKIQPSDCVRRCDSNRSSVIICCTSVVIGLALFLTLKEAGIERYLGFLGLVVNLCCLVIHLRSYAEAKFFSTDRSPSPE